MLVRSVEVGQSRSIFADPTLDRFGSSNLNRLFPIKINQFFRENAHIKLLIRVLLNLGKYAQILLVINDDNRHVLEI